MKKAYRVLNQNVRWRVFEKECLEKSFGETEDVQVSELASFNIGDSIIFWKLNTEETSAEQIEICYKFETEKQNYHINPPSGFLNCHAKESCFEIWKNNNIPCPNHFEFSNIEDFKKKINFDFPYLIRLNNLCAGKGTYLISDEQELEPGLKRLDEDFNSRKNSLTKKICVEFIDTKDHKGKNSSYRVIVAGEKVITGYARVNQGGHWNVTTASFNHDFNKFSQDFIEYNELCHEIISTHEDDIVKAVKLTNNHHVGLDIIRDPSGKIYFIEIQPGYQTGYANSPGPFYNPIKKDMVQYLLDNKESLEGRLPLYYNDWLNKKTHFNKVFKELKRCLDLTQRNQ